MLWRWHCCGSFARRGSRSKAHDWMCPPPPGCVQVDIASAVRSRPCWHPDGSLLAAPGTDKNIVMYERLSWQLDPSTELAGEHSGDVSIVAFSSNGAAALDLEPGCERGKVWGWSHWADVASASFRGSGGSEAEGRGLTVAWRCQSRRCMGFLYPTGPPCRPPTAGLYLASAAADQSVVVWDVLGKKALKKQVLAGAAYGAAWHPTKNTLALITEDGEARSGKELCGLGLEEG